MEGEEEEEMKEEVVKEEDNNIEEEEEREGQEDKNSQMKFMPLLLIMYLSIVWLWGRLGNWAFPGDWTHDSALATDWDEH